jgi:type IV pilus assembly protein PilC
MTPIYRWHGRTRQGNEVHGEMDAAGAEAVVAKLRSRNILADTVRPASRGRGFLGMLGGKVSEREIVIFTRQFATMIDAGLPLVQCLGIIVGQLANPTFRRVLTEVKDDVESGSTFARALAKHPKVFDRLFVALVAAGEVGGILDTILNRLGAYIEKTMKLKKRVKGAMVYPAAVMTVAFVVVTVLLVWVIPSFNEMFAQFDKRLPFPTQVVVDFSAFVRAAWWVLFPALFGTIFGIRTLLATDRGREVWDRWVLELPVFGDLLRKVAVAKFTRTLSTMLTSGVPILDALEIVAKTAGNKTIERAILRTKERIAEGKTIAEPLAETGVFPPMVVQMITVGEATGALDAMLSKIADFYEDEVDITVDALTTLLEPMMLVFLGGTVGGLLVTMYLPIFRFVELF